MVYCEFDCPLRCTVHCTVQRTLTSILDLGWNASALWLQKWWMAFPTDLPTYLLSDLQMCAQICLNFVGKSVWICADKSVWSFESGRRNPGRHRGWAGHWSLRIEPFQTIYYQHVCNVSRPCSSAYWHPLHRIYTFPSLSFPFIMFRVTPLDGPWPSLRPHYGQWILCLIICIWCLGQCISLFRPEFKMA